MIPDDVLERTWRAESVVVDGAEGVPEEILEATWRAIADAEAVLDGVDAKLSVRRAGGVSVRKAPFPWFGGKADATPAVRAALGDVDHYVEPFAGSLAVLLRRPHLANRSYFSETVNDADGLLCNVWRAIQLHPDATAEAASWPVSEADLHARHLAILRWRRERDVERLMGDPAFCDPVIAGWWLWGISSWIGSGWCSGTGPWIVGDDGRITKRAGAGGVSRQLPHVSDGGRGVNRPQPREEGVSRQCPHVSNNGQGVNRSQLREAGVSVEREFHPMTMPELRRWFAFLAARLRHARILCGDWRRAVTTGVTHTLSVRQGGHAGIFLDPPYADTAERDSDLYTHDSGTVAHEVREWAIEAGADPKNRIVLAGFADEHGDAFERVGWREVEWFAAGFLKGGFAQQSDDGHQQARERLWCSPACLVTRQGGTQMSLFVAARETE